MNAPHVLEIKYQIMFQNIRLGSRSKAESSSDRIVVVQSRT